jgi:hypothetical protein
MMAVARRRRLAFLQSFLGGLAKAFNRTEESMSLVQGMQGMRGIISSIHRRMHIYFTQKKVG